MAKPIHDDDEKESALEIDTSSALQDIGYNSSLAAENGTSSEDEAPEAQAIPAEDARMALGFSISLEQTRLTSPQTPSVEKAAAIEKAEGFWGGFDRTEDTLFEEPEEDVEGEQDEPEYETAAGADVEEERPSTTLPPEPSLPERSSPRTEAELPSPWRVEPNARWQTSERPRSGLLDGIFSRRRASSGPSPTVEGKQRSLLSSLPSLTSMPKHFSFSSYISGSRETGQSSESDMKTSPSTWTTPRSQRSGSDRRTQDLAQKVVLPKSEIDSEDSRRASVQTGRSSTGLLRRSTSDHSLTTQRTLSRSATLGDDSRFEDVHGQVNSRLKAIRDSWQDTNIRFSSLSNIKVPNFTPDFLRERAVSVNKRQSVRQISVETTTSISAKQAKPIDPMTRQPYSSAKAISDAQSGKLSAHPHFNRALEQLEGDVVVLGGYRGSILRSAEPPQRQVWVPMKVGLNIRKVNLEVGFEEGDDERATDYIIPDGMLTHIGPVDISRRLFKRLRACENAKTGKLTIRDYGYDWRLAPQYLSNQFIQFLENLPCNQSGVSRETRGATVIAHSLGGLITRHAINQRPELFKGVVYAGVPQTCVNILGPLRNGDEVRSDE